MKRILYCITLGVACLASADGQVISTSNKESERQAREVYSGLISDPKRDPWQMPDQVVQSLAIKQNENILEVGDDPGGYFGRRLARLARNVTVLNPSNGFLASYQKEKPDNLQPITGAFDDFKLSGGLVDTIFLYNALPNLQFRTLYFALAGAIVGPQGRIVVIDFFKNTPPPGTPPNQNITDATVISEMKMAGFQLAQRFDYLPVQFFLVFTR
jgi:arsenite methyltransferase